MKKVESKVEEAKVQLSEDQLTKVRKQQEEITQLLKDIGFLDTQKHTLNHKYAASIQEIEDFKAELEKEYGAVNINLETGICTPIEKKSE